MSCWWRKVSFIQCLSFPRARVASGPVKAVTSFGTIMGRIGEKEGIRACGTARKMRKSTADSDPHLIWLVMGLGTSLAKLHEPDYCYADENQKKTRCDKKRQKADTLHNISSFEHCINSFSILHSILYRQDAL